MEKKLKKGKDKQIAGVCSGIAEYLDVDVNLVRIICTVVCIFCYPAIIIYIILAASLPDGDNNSIKNEFKDYDEFNDDEDEDRIDEYDDYEEYSEDDEWNDNRNYNNQKVYNSFEHTNYKKPKDPFEL